MRVLIDHDPFAHHNASRGLWARNTWPAKWISHPSPGGKPFVVAYRLRLQLDKAATIRLHVSADERYALYIDGALEGRGPERGDPDHWCFETYQVSLAAGDHVIVARVWSLGSGEANQMAGDTGGGAGHVIAAPYAQLSVYHGFLLACDDAYLPLLATGVAPWQATVLAGYVFTPPGVAWGAGARVIINGNDYAWGHEHGIDDRAWVDVIARHGAVTPGRMEAGPSHVLTPARLPAMERPAFPVAESQKTFALNTRESILLDLGNYFCFHPILHTQGGRGARVKLSYAESLYESADASTRRKGKRDQTAGKHFIGVGDEFILDGGERAYETLWWSAGRFIQIEVQTADEPLSLRLELRETRYPLEMQAMFDSSDPRLAETTPILLRGLQMCAHETYMDCPYYEQLMYAGDSRLEALVTYVISPDDRLPKKCIELFDHSRLSSGLTQSRYPSRVRQVIPPFSLWWIGMVHDHLMWRNDPAFIRARLPGVRAVMEAYLGFRNADGLIEGPATAWNFVDWTVGWKNGVPPDGDYGVSSVINWQFIYTLRLAREIELYAGETELAARLDRIARESTAATHAAFWEPVRGLYADDRAKRHFSEHAQCLAILSGLLDGDRTTQMANNLLTSKELARTTIYFTHYLFDALRVLPRHLALAADPIDHLFNRLSLWFNLKSQGFVTPPEEPEPSRSDCHGWGAHPLFHYFATILGVRPAAPHFAEVEITPSLSYLTHANGEIPHPNGIIEVRLQQSNRHITGDITLPKNLTGVFRSAGGDVALRPGRNTLVPTSIS